MWVGVGRVALGLVLCCPVGSACFGRPLPDDASGLILFAVFALLFAFLSLSPVGLVLVLVVRLVVRFHSCFFGRSFSLFASLSLSVAHCFARYFHDDPPLHST